MLDGKVLQLALRSYTACYGGARAADRDEAWQRQRWWWRQQQEKEAIELAVAACVAYALVPPCQQVLQPRLLQAILQAKQTEEVQALLPLSPSPKSIYFVAVDRPLPLHFSSSLCPLSLPLHFSFSLRAATRPVDPVRILSF